MRDPAGWFCNAFIGSTIGPNPKAPADEVLNSFIFSGPLRSEPTMEARWSPDAAFPERPAPTVFHRAVFGPDMMAEQIAAERHYEFAATQ